MKDINEPNYPLKLAKLVYWLIIIALWVFGFWLLNWSYKGRTDGFWAFVVYIFVLITSIICRKWKIRKKRKE